MSLPLPRGIRVLVATEPVDLRKSFGTPGKAWRFQQVQFLPRQGEEPPHRESSLWLMEATTWVKCRQSDIRAVTQVKRLSRVTTVSGGRRSRTSRKAPCRRPLEARPPETPARSERMARMDMEASGTWEIHRGLRSSRSMPSNRHIRRQANAAVEVGLADSTRSAGKPRTWGSGEQGDFSSWGHMGCTQRQ